MNTTSEGGGVVGIRNFRKSEKINLRRGLSPSKKGKGAREKSWDKRVDKSMISSPDCKTSGSSLGLREEKE